MLASGLLAKSVSFKTPMATFFILFLSDLVELVEVTAKEKKT